MATTRRNSSSCATAARSAATHCTSRPASIPGKAGGAGAGLSRRRRPRRAHGRRRALWIDRQGARSRFRGRFSQRSQPLFRAWPTSPERRRLLRQRPRQQQRRRRFYARRGRRTSVARAIDRQRVFATRMSNGGMMAYRLAREVADLVRGRLPSPAPRPSPTAGRHGRFLSCTSTPATDARSAGRRRRPGCIPRREQGHGLLGAGNRPPLGRPQRLPDVPNASLERPGAWCQLQRLSRRGHGPALRHQQRRPFPARGRDCPARQAKARPQALDAAAH